MEDQEHRDAELPRTHYEVLQDAISNFRHARGVLFHVKQDLGDVFRLDAEKGIEKSAGKIGAEGEKEAKEASQRDRGRRGCGASGVGDGVLFVVAVVWDKV